MFKNEEKEIRKTLKTIDESGMVLSTAQCSVATVKNKGQQSTVIQAKNQVTMVFGQTNHRSNL